MSEQQAKRKPNWTLCVKEGEKWRAIGAAWDTERGNLFVKLDEGVALKGTAMMFPYREKRESKYTARTWRPASAQAAAPPGSDYMERKRAERRPPPPAAPPSLPDDDSCPDPEPPAWLD